MILTTTVSDGEEGNLTSSRDCQTSVSLEITVSSSNANSVDLLIVSISSIGGEGDEIKASSSLRLLGSSKRLDGTSITGHNNLRYFWSEKNNLLSPSQIYEIQESAINSSNLVLPGSSLLPGNTYTFQLESWKMPGNAQNIKGYGSKLVLTFPFLSSGCQQNKRKQTDVEPLLYRNSL